MLVYSGDPSLILLSENNLQPDFFDLSSGLAGSVLGKLAQYRVKTAVVADLDGIRSERFQELIFEMNKGKQVNFFRELEKAEQWLTEQELAGGTTLDRNQ